MDTTTPQIEIDNNSSPTSTTPKKEGSLGVIIIITVVVVFIAILAILGWIAYQVYSYVPDITDTAADTTISSNNPAPPDGFDWVHCTQAGAFFLQPDGWNFYEAETEHGQACTISESVIDIDTPDEKGVMFSVLYTSDARTATGYSPSAYSELFTTEFKGYSNVIEYESFESNGFDFQRVEFEDEGDTYLYFLLSSDDKDLFYLMWFTGPTSTWDDDQVIGREIFDNLLFEPETDTI